MYKFFNRDNEFLLLPHEGKDGKIFESELLFNNNFFDTAATTK